VPIDPRIDVMVGNRTLDFSLCRSGRGHYRQAARHDVELRSSVPWMDSASIAAPATAERSGGPLGPSHPALSSARTGLSSNERLRLGPYIERCRAFHFSRTPRAARETGRGRVARSIRGSGSLYGYARAEAGCTKGGLELLRCCYTAEMVLFALVC
jgi:hypothetical protein